MTACIDCSRTPAATIVQYTRTHDGKIRSWHVCSACARAFEERKDAAEREWREQEQALRAQLARTPFGQATPDSMRRAVRR